MKEYVATRLLLLIPTLLGITLVVFFAMHAIPGDPIISILGEDYDKNFAAQLRAEYGLDQPVIVQYGLWLLRLVQGDWGKSINSHRPVLSDVLYRIPITAELIIFALLLALLIAVPAGVIASTRPYAIRDYSSMTIAMIGISIPEFFFGILLMLCFGLLLGWLPTGRFVSLADSVPQNLVHLILPAVALGFHRAAILTRLVRSSMLEVIRQDYVMTARSKGLVERLVVLKHALKNALIPTVTVVGLQIGFLIGGAIVVEKVFSIPGLGSYGIDAILARDYPQVQGFIVVAASVFVLSNLLVDILYAFLDPRIRYEKKGA
jgi:peptide/nickel transport system permease protein